MQDDNRKTMLKDGKPRLVRPRIHVPERRSLRDRELWSLIIECMSATLNLFLGILNLVLGIMHASPWHFTLAVYFAFLTALDAYLSVKEEHGLDASPRFKRAYGVSIIILASFTTVMLELCIGLGLLDPYDEFPMIATAAITFVFLAMAITRIIWARNGSDAKRILAALSLASTLGSLLTLMISMIGTFGSANGPGIFWLEVASGFVFVVPMLIIGIQLIVRKKR